MPGVLQQLEHSQAVLLMYLAEELSRSDRDEVERMLSVDAGMRAELETLREATDWFSAEMARDDRAARPAVPEPVAVRRVGRLIRQWHARRLEAAPVTRSASTLRYPWWAYPVAAAASVVIAFLVWWGNAEPTARLDRGSIAHSISVNDEPTAQPDPATVRAFMIEQTLVSQSSPDPYAPPAVGDGSWEESETLYAAVDSSDDNVLMLLNSADDDADDDEVAPDDDPTTSFQF